MAQEKNKDSDVRSSVVRKWFLIYVVFIVIAVIAFIVFIVGARIYYHFMTASAPITQMVSRA